jgi:hypothetical protein
MQGKLHIDSYWETLTTHTKIFNKSFRDYQKLIKWGIKLAATHFTTALS